MRLLNPDGTREGRDLDIHVPQSALTGGLKLWHLVYGQGLLLDVWGLTDYADGVLAYRLAMPKLPDEARVAYALDRGVPMHPKAIMQSSERPEVRLYQVPGATVAAVRTWYRETLPTFDWRPDGLAQGPGDALTFGHASTGLLLHVAFTQRPDGVQVTLTWLGDQPDV